ncbi:M56 family metallopeptidase [Aequorivita viscosa]|uniref:Signal transducer regulating beta-lactamase production, contains metallopeptidase domain n=1 Tax=Aequorivita viscosa TaxID=797419 RepID=A0A1M6L467_9FLAO|nr:M56 family metallopeptidase [Aequorivita viscosa]SDX23418.1 Signal transducer regulating beta-lactamase production, contains metallopeptidase domain [Aequorivita viscosa]SHJ66045.1 Signal transducer regulating beta-lactamase production, contains metallopeptidase domain [Aequorivita viscosa]
MIHTILQILVFQLLFLAVYDLFLKKETFFNLNRVYLLLTPILSIVLPYVSLDFLQQNIPQEYVIQLPAVILGNTALEAGSDATFWLSTLNSLWIIGILATSFIFSLKLLKIFKLRVSGTRENIKGTSLILLPETDLVFSLFNTIYLGKDISQENKASIIAHEKVHIQQKHSLDLLYFELLRIVFWFNPLVYMFQNRIATLHEYIADSEITRDKDKKQYYQNLLSEVFQTEQISFVNTFFKQSLIKKRIIMLQKSKSQKGAQVKYLLLLPIIFSMLFYTACSDNPKVDTDQQSEAEILNKIKEQEEAKIEEYRINQEKENITVQIDTIMGGDPVTDVPYSVIDQVPTYPGCSGDNETMRKCMSSKIAESINSNFNTSIANDLNLSGRQRIAVQFKIDKTGNVTDVRARAKHPELETEAMRVVNLLPQMKPGEQKGEKVGVLYSLPIVFNIVE